MNYCFLHPFSFPPKSRKQVKPENSSDLGRSKRPGNGNLSGDGKEVPGRKGSRTCGQQCRAEAEVESQCGRGLDTLALGGHVNGEVFPDASRTWGREDDAEWC